jgi:hypothetical protein
MPKLLPEEDALDRRRDDGAVRAPRTAESSCRVLPHPIRVFDIFHLRYEA